jgi:hypothetical protein
MKADLNEPRDKISLRAFYVKGIAKARWLLWNGCFERRSLEEVLGGRVFLGRIGGLGG